MFNLRAQADEQAPVRPGQAARDERGRVCLDDLADADLDYGSDRAGLAALRRRLHSAITAYNGAPPALRGCRCLFEWGCAACLANALNVCYYGKLLRGMGAELCPCRAAADTTCMGQVAVLV